MEEGGGIGQKVLKLCNTLYFFKFCIVRTRMKFKIWYMSPHPLVQRCNGTTAGLGYLEVLELSMKILLLGQLASVRTMSTPNGVEDTIHLLT